MSSSPLPIYEFDDFHLDPGTRLLSRAGVPVPLTSRVFETLLYLVQHHDNVLEKDRLLDAVWPDSVVEENNLTQNIYTLRRVLGEKPSSHRFIVTVPGRGYRFVADVRTRDRAAEPAISVAPNEATESSAPTDPQAPARGAAAKGTNLVVALGLLLICAFLIAGAFAFRNSKNPSPAVPTTTSVPPANLPAPKSIAVLPFESLSGDVENAYFTTGVQEEILSNLAKIADLKVISRTSANLYKSGSPRHVREIGLQLGVTYLLEGSVQRSGERLRVHAQLIDTRTDSHIWAQTYDRELADVFAIQSEIAQTIADQLGAKISEREKTAIAQAATSDLIANDLYQKALALELQSPPENLLKAVSLLEQAVARDPRFFLAYCALARIHLIFPNLGYDHTVAHLEMAEANIEKALQLRPDHGEVHLVRGRYFGMGVREYDRARAELELARRTLPNDPAVYFETALIDRRQGRWTEALRNLERTVELDPRNADFLIETAITYREVHRYAEAARLWRRAVVLSPKDYYVRLFGPNLPLRERADIRPQRNELNAILAEEPAAATKLSCALLACAILERDSAAADRALATFPPGETGLGPGLTGPREWYVGYVARLFQRPDVAHEAFEVTRTTLKQRVLDQPDNASAWSLLGLVEAALGRKEEAIESGHHACEILPLSREALSGLMPLQDLAKIYAWVGEKDLALQYLATYGGQTPGLDYGELKLNPDWDSLRGDPRFEKIVASLAPKN